MNLKMKTSNKSARTGGAIAIIIILLLLIGGGVAGGFLFSGSRQQKAQTQLLAEGYLNFNQGQLEKAYDKFVDARQTFSTSLDLYRKVASGTFLTRDEVNEVLATLCLSIAHEKFFMLEADTNWVKKAEEELKNISDSERKKEISQNLATANEIVALLTLFKAGDYEKAMKDLLEVEKKAAVSDQDFFIFEIRFLIACGKSLQEPAIINQARELLFFATTDLGINNEKTRQLWGLLTN